MFRNLVRIMRYFHSDYLFTGTATPVKEAAVAVTDDGTVVGMVPASAAPADSVYLPGVLCPGFINAHCHLELSGMKGAITEGTGLPGFISAFIKKRPIGEFPAGPLEEAQREMADKGIVAVADIANTAATAGIKKKGLLHYHTFVEVYGVDPAQAAASFGHGLEVLSRFDGQKASITPHAPYSVADTLFQLISGQVSEGPLLLSMHNQESSAENELFAGGTGKLVEFYRDSGIGTGHIHSTGLTSLQSVIGKLPSRARLLLVHNTFTSREDIQFAHRSFEDIYWCFCPNANRYIENTLPDFEMFIREGATCCLGTDSYASNHSLSVLEEMKTIQRHARGVKFEDMIQWATINGARFLGIDDRYGSISPGKKPGLVHIGKMDTGTMTLTDESMASRVA